MTSAEIAKFIQWKPELVHLGAWHKDSGAAKGEVRQGLISPLAIRNTIDQLLHGCILAKAKNSVREYLCPYF